MEESLRFSPIPSKVLKSFINLEADESEPPDVFSSSQDGRQNINALVTLPRGLQSSSLSSLQSTITEESELPKKNHSSFSRKGPIRRTSTNNIHHTNNPVLMESPSPPLDDGMPIPYNPNKPLTKIPIKQQIFTNHLQSTDNYFTRSKSIKATIGPLTKEVCGKLNISWEDSDPCVSPQDNKVRARCASIAIQCMQCC